MLDSPGHEAAVVGRIGWKQRRLVPRLNGQFQRMVHVHLLFILLRRDEGTRVVQRSLHVRVSTMVHGHPNEVTGSTKLVDCAGEGISKFTGVNSTRNDTRLVGGLSEFLIVNDPVELSWALVLTCHNGVYESRLGHHELDLIRSRLISAMRLLDRQQVTRYRTLDESGHGTRQGSHSRVDNFGSEDPVGMLLSILPNTHSYLFVCLGSLFRALLYYVKGTTSISTHVSRGP